MVNQKECGNKLRDACGESKKKGKESCSTQILFFFKPTELFLFFSLVRYHFSLHFNMRWLRLDGWICSAIKVNAVVSLSLGILTLNARPRIFVFFMIKNNDNRKLTSIFNFWFKTKLNGRMTHEPLLGCLSINVMTLWLIQIYSETNIFLLTKLIWEREKKINKLFIGLR